MYTKRELVKVDRACHWPKASRTRWVFRWRAWSDDPAL